MFPWGPHSWPLRHVNGGMATSFTWYGDQLCKWVAYVRFTSWPLCMVRQVGESNVMWAENDKSTFSNSYTFLFSPLSHRNFKKRRDLTQLVTKCWPQSDEQKFGCCIPNRFEDICGKRKLSWAGGADSFWCQPPFAKRQMPIRCQGQGDESLKCYKSTRTYQHMYSDSKELHMEKFFQQNFQCFPLGNHWKISGNWKYSLKNIEYVCKNKMSWTLYKKRPKAHLLIHLVIEEFEVWNFYPGRWSTLIFKSIENANIAICQ